MGVVLLHGVVVVVVVADVVLVAIVGQVTVAAHEVKLRNQTLVH